MRMLLVNTEYMGDLIVSLPVQKYILENCPSAEIFWFVRPETAPILEHLPGVQGVFPRHPDPRIPYKRIFSYIKPDVLLNLSPSDYLAIPAAKKAGIPVRVAAPINRIFSRKNLAKNLRQCLDATHVIWTLRHHYGKHESQLKLLFLEKLGWPVPESIPDAVSPVLTADEIARGKADLKEMPSPRLGVILRGVSGASPSLLWWEKMLAASKKAGWNPVPLSPPEECGLPPTTLRGLMARLSACDAVVGTSTAPTHLAASLNVPTLCLMGQRKTAGPSRWAPLGRYVETIQYPGGKSDYGGGMDSMPIDKVLELLQKTVGDVIQFPAASFQL